MCVSSVCVRVVRCALRCVHFYLLFCRSLALLNGGEYDRIERNGKRPCYVGGIKIMMKKTSISYFIASYYTPAGTKYKYDAPVVSEDYE